MSTPKANRSTTRSLRASGQPLSPSEAQKTPSSDPASGDSLEVIPTSNYNGHQQLSVFPSDELGAESHPLHSARDIPPNSLTLLRETRHRNRPRVHSSRNLPVQPTYFWGLFSTLTACLLRVCSSGAFDDDSDDAGALGAGEPDGDGRGDGAGDDGRRGRGRPKAHRRGDQPPGSARNGVYAIAYSSWGSYSSS